jgi:hypothetical protein
MKQEVVYATVSSIYKNIIFLLICLTALYELQGLCGFICCYGYQLRIWKVVGLVVTYYKVPSQCLKGLRNIITYMSPYSVYWLRF